jgi:hypothetical protein
MCQASLLMKLKSDRVTNYKHFTPSGVAMHSDGVAKRCASIKYNFNPRWEAHMSAHSWILNMAAAAPEKPVHNGIRSNKLQIRWLFPICAGDRQSERQR